MISERSDTVSDVAGQLTAQRSALASRLERIDRIVAVMSGKGGVGKTAITANLAAALANGGRRVGALDADLTGQSLALMLGIVGQQPAITRGGLRPGHGPADVAVMSMDLFMDDAGQPLTWRHGDGLAADTYVWRGLVEANAVREMAADTDWGDLDVLLLDLPPGTERFETVARLFPRLDAVLAVTTPSAVSVRVVRKAVRAVEASPHPLLGAIVNMAGVPCPDCGSDVPLFGNRTAAAVATSLGCPLLGSVPWDGRMESGAAEGIPVVLTTPDAPISVSLRQTAERLAANLWPGTQPAPSEQAPQSGRALQSGQAAQSGQALQSGQAPQSGQATQSGQGHAS